MRALLLTIALMIPGVVWAGTPAGQNINPCPDPNAAHKVPIGSGTLFVCFYGSKPKTGTDGWASVAGVSFYRLSRGSQSKPELLFEADEDQHSIDYRIDKDNLQIITYLDTYPDFKGKKFYLERFDLHAAPIQRHFKLIYKPMPVSRKQVAAAESFLEMDQSTYEARYQDTDVVNPLYKHLFLIRDFGFVDPAAAAAALKPMETYWWCDGAVAEELSAFEENVAIAKKIFEPPQPPRAGPTLSVYGNGFTVSASSELRSPTHRYTPANILAPSIQTAWCEGVKGLGMGQTLHLNLRKAISAPSIELAILPGYAKSDLLFTANARPTDMTVRFDGTFIQKIALKDQPHEQSFLLSTTKTGGHVQDIDLVLDQITPGERYADTCISEVSIRVPGWWKNAPDTELKSEAKIVANREKRAKDGNLDAIDALVQLANGAYDRSAEGSEWLGEIYVDLLIAHPYKLLYVAGRQRPSVREAIYKAIAHPVTDKYSAKQINAALDQAARSGIAKNTIDSIRSGMGQ